MNKKNVAFALAALSLALVSCNHPSDGSASSTDLSSNSSSDQSSTLPAEDHNPLKQAAYDFISTASKSVNYTYGLKGEGGAIVSKAIITPNYIAYPESGSATVALPSYTGEGKILYSAEKIDGAYGITSALTYTDPTTGEVSGYTSISELDYLDLLLRYGLSADSFTYQSGYLLVEDANLVTILATMFGLSSYIDYIMRISISYDETAGKMEVGFVSNFLTLTKGYGIINHTFREFRPVYAHSVGERQLGVLVSVDKGPATPYSIEKVEDHGTMFIAPGTICYEGMIVGEHRYPVDLAVNVTAAKPQTNVRSSTKDQTVVLKSPRKMTLEACLDYINSDELVEITPSAFRMRKKILNTADRKKFDAHRKAEAEAEGK